MTKKPVVTLIAVLVWVFSINAQNDSIPTTQNDSNLKSIDSTKQGNKALPIAIPITEPAIGVGLTGGLMYFLPKKDPSEQVDMIVGGAGFTSNGSWLAGVGYLGYWNKDKVRYTGFSGYGEITMDYYGFDPDEPFEFDQKVLIFMQQALVRIKRSNFFLGGKYQFSRIRIPFFIEGDNGESLYLDDLDLTNSGVSLILEYDNLNHFLSPTKGVNLHLSYDQNLEILGSNRNWGVVNMMGYGYFPVNENYIPGFRVESKIVTGFPPFYAFPFIDLRGIPVLRYQGKSTLTIETEQLYNFAKRWGAVGFTGLGFAFNSVDENGATNTVWNAGGGIRFLASRSRGVKIGMDLGRGPEEWAYYFTVGSSW